MSGDKTIIIRPYPHDRDFYDIRRIWKEAGWMEYENEGPMALLLGKTAEQIKKKQILLCQSLSVQSMFFHGYGLASGLRQSFN
ncbi:TPA: hypothetical protein DCG86_04600 [Candidatus Marinimicrobia bacterium]|nr:hypothetical protein [Candidatus Neomarinimicrobiota bacterium]HBY17655.1 hypothetical protein [Candidatus Neomarinimicrobiota bacterium]